MSLSKFSKTQDFVNDDSNHHSNMALADCPYFSSTNELGFKSNHPSLSLDKCPFFSQKLSNSSQSAFQPSYNLHTTNTNHVFAFDLPGLTPENVKVQVKNKTHLVVSGERSEVNKSTDGYYVHCESQFGSFTRSVKLPEDTVHDTVSAKFSNGVLHVSFNRLEQVEDTVNVSVQ